ncbi:MAG: hypothetical protein H6905_09795 [Hyphomicrobiales bacterium]|nr:hypothetical protein [Hyphomicrobiales bacterium]
MDTQTTHALVPVEDTRTVLRFLDFEGFIELVETGSLAFRRWEGSSGADSEAARFLHEKLPETLLNIAAREKPKGGNKLQRWWAAKERDAEREKLIASVRSFKLPDVAWVDRWHLSQPENAVLWRIHEAAGRTICVESSVADLTHSLVLEPLQKLTMGAVIYDDERASGTASSGGTLHPALYEPEHLAFEKAFHAIVSVSGSTAFAKEHGFAVKTGRLVHAVYLAPATPERRVELVGKLLQRCGLSIPCGPIDFAPRSRSNLPLAI